MPGNLRTPNFVSALIGGVVVAVVFGVLALTGTFDSGDDEVTATPTAVTTTVPAPSSSTSTPARSATDVSDLYRRVRDGVAYIQVQAQSSTPFGDQDQEASGSGFVLDKQGYILTNDHVVENATSVRVRVGGGDQLITAKVTGTDPSSDLAIVKVNPSDVEGGLTPLALGSSESVEVGQPAIAIGSPFGLQGSLTTGVISALGRSITAPNGFQISGALQTDAAINPGNSGGPLLNAAGQVIGINAQIETGSSGTNANSGIGFAIPIDTAKTAIPALEHGQRIRRAYLGVSTADATSGGASVAQVIGGGPADKAGMRVGDRIVSVGGHEIGESADVASAISPHKPGDTVPVVVVRDGKRTTLQVKLGTQPQQAQGG